MVKQVTECIGNTPLIEIPAGFYNSNNKIFVKLEEFNLGGSVKSRAAYQMIIDAEENGTINPLNANITTIIEPTGGNTGIGIAQICALRGYRCILVVPDNYSKIRVRILKALGAEIVLSDSRTGNDSHIRKALEIHNDNPSFVMLDQFSNSSNPKAHYLHTGPEIINCINSNIDFFVAGIGTGGTISGVGRAIKEYYPLSKVFAVQPEGCDVLNGFAIPHIIQGIAIGQIPKVLDRDIVDGVLDVKESDVIEVQKRLSKELGLFLGYSSAANICASINLSTIVGYDKTIVTISPDGGKNYEI